MQKVNFNNIAIDELSIPLLREKKIKVSVLRLDKIHPEVSGNKWFKLRYYLEQAKKENKKTIITFGGAWSNHILATAVACKMYDLESIGIIRGEENFNSSYTLVKAIEAGMKFIYLNRTDYRNKIIPEQFKSDDYYVINEGGYGNLGMLGSASILDYCKKEAYTHICCAAGTGTMTAGLITASSPLTIVTAISVLKNNIDLHDKIKHLAQNSSKSFAVIHDYHFGGYAKYKPGLIEFMNTYYSQTNIPSDFVYTGKLFYAVDDLINNNYFPTDSKLLIIHSGGLQGNRSLKKGTLIF